ncbi:PREDICTED: dehydrogenase/reductase SDR family member 7B-like [Amphimedon queenslandica]|uniref:Ketoreductase domain-containing protein n=1 Tax=Amphimedon queenslandica TaxID=400682 RepID=A0A1X7UJB2_AMPQE|nr:PREDICTED: dehydrogenase/reductase SDR family member 7B-like [Amphimedon queenslandica]|eukprot:XP_003387672.1 PREDICTED: dehydrogenase/reductase SDR family member 7B-like [Amphimedon queenslandica]
MKLFLILKVTFLLLSLAGLYKVYKRWKLRQSLSSLSGKVVLITGASSGLGEALAFLLHSVGAKLILAGRNVHKLKQIQFTLDTDTHTQVKGLIKKYSPAILEIDLTESHALSGHGQNAIKIFGRIDILVNNAGVSSRGSVIDTDIRVDRTIMETNYFGSIQLTKMLLPYMLEEGGGHIVVISSLQGKLGLPYRSSYSASKHALHGYYDSLRAELSPRGISVTILCFGYINTRLSVNALTADGTSHGVLDATTSNGLSAERAAQCVLEAIALKERERIVASPIHHVAVYLKLLSPSLLDWALRKRSKSN